jgi:hypothetical protein
VSRRYLPWWRTGATTLITTPDGPGIASRAAVDVTATVNAGASATVTARLYGPGEAQLIDPRQVIRTEPEPGTPNFEPNYFPSVELDAPELPWMLTPAKANAAQQLRPWLVLVVVPRAACRLDTGAVPMPVLAVEDAAADLPDLDQSWAWAHVQVTGTGAPADILRSGDAERTLSRLVCPRRLTARTAYVAAVVSAFAQGVQAGLGEAVDPGPLRPAWDATTTFVELPVHHSWEFATGDLGDFEELASRLHFAPLDPKALGGMRMRADDLQAGLPDAGIIRVPGALGAGADAPAPVGAPFAGALRALLDLVSATPAHADLPVPVPAYGRWHAGRRAAPAVGAGGWPADLNLHPAARAVAALGTRVVQERQEQLMAAGWAQVGPIARANRLLRQGQLAREASAALHRRQVALLPDADLLAVAGPALGRILHGRRTAAAVVAEHRVPPALFAVAARRALRRRGPVGRRAACASPRWLRARTLAAALPSAGRSTGPPAWSRPTASASGSICRACAPPGRSGGASSRARPSSRTGRSRRACATSSPATAKGSALARRRPRRTRCPSGTSRTPCAPPWTPRRPSPSASGPA